MVLYLYLAFTTQVTSSAWLTAIHHFSPPRTPSEQKRAQDSDNRRGVEKAPLFDWDELEGSTDHGGGAAYRRWCASRLGYLIRVKRPYAHST